MSMSSIILDKVAKYTVPDVFVSHRQIYSPSTNSKITQDENTQVSHLTNLSKRPVACTQDKTKIGYKIVHICFLIAKVYLSSSFKLIFIKKRNS